MTPSKKIHVLHLSTPSTWRGGEQQLLYLVEELAQNELVTQTVACPVDSVLSNKLKRLRINQIEIRKEFLNIWKSARVVANYTSNNNVNVIHTHDSKAHTIAVLGASYFNNICPIIVSRRVDFPISSSWSAKYKYNHDQVKKIICVSDAIKKITAKRIIDPFTLTTIHSGIDLTKFEQNNQENYLRKNFDLPEDKYLIGNVAAIAPHKDYYTFINTVEEYVKVKDDAHFLIIGDGPDHLKIKAYCKQKQLNNHITFTGFVKNIIPAIQSLDVFLITSKTEGLGTSILDALGCGIPVVATKAGGIPEIIKDNETGLLSPTGNAQHLSENLKRLLSHPKLKDEIVLNGKEWVKNFSKSITAKKTFDIYQEVSL